MSTVTEHPGERESTMPSTCKEKLPYNIDWIIPTLRHPTKLWYFASSLTIAAVGLFSKIIIGWLLG